MNCIKKYISHLHKIGIVDFFVGDGFATDLTTLYSANRNICEPIRKRVRSIAKQLTAKDKKKLLQEFAGKF